AGPGVAGSSAGDTVFGATSSDTTPPTAMLNAANVTNANAGSLTPYTFTVAYSDGVLVNGSSVVGAVVRVQPPGGGAALTATAVKTALPGLQDGKGDAQPFTVTYRVTPPGGAWTSTDNGTYTIKLVSSPPTDLAGNAPPLGELGTFTADVTKPPASPPPPAPP